MAVKVITDPCAIEVFELGIRVIFPGKSGGPGWEPPPHPAMLPRERIASASQKAFEYDLPMHPLKPCPDPRPEITQDEPWNELENL